MGEGIESTVLFERNEAFRQTDSEETYPNGPIPPSPPPSPPI